MRKEKKTKENRKRHLVEVRKHQDYDQKGKREKRQKKRSGERMKRQQQKMFRKMKEEMTARK